MCITRRHHCHICGLAVCNDCSGERLKLHPNFRVCHDCFKENEDKAKVQLSLRPAPVLVVKGSLTKQGSVVSFRHLAYSFTPLASRVGLHLASPVQVRSWKQRTFLLDSTGLFAYFKSGSTQVRECWQLGAGWGNLC